jgi:hypothetical protein
MIQAQHQRLEFAGITASGSELSQPFAKEGAQGLVP